MYAIVRIMDHMSPELHQNLHQRVSVGSRLGFGCFSASFISYYLTIINRLLTNTYKTTKQIRNPLLYPAELRAQTAKTLFLYNLQVLLASKRVKFIQLKLIILLDVLKFSCKLSGFLYNNSNNAEHFSTIR